MTNKCSGINVLSLFDGMSCGQIALRELGIKVRNYYASEIDRFAIAQTQLNFPDTIQLGDVRNIHAEDLPRIDLLIGGSPCQGFSFAGKQLNFDDPRSGLFFEFVRILKECRELNPDVKFMLENVRMKRECERVISDALGVEPVMINSALVSAQNRVRLYWSNIRTRTEGLFGTVYTDIPQPKDRGLYLRDVLESEVEDKYYLSERVVKNLLVHKERNKKAGNGFGLKPRCSDDKMGCIHVGGAFVDDVVIVQRSHGYNAGGEFRAKAPSLTSSAYEHNNIVCISSTQSHATIAENKSTPLVAAMGMGGGHVPMIAQSGQVLRRITPTEAARLQTIPEWYKWECSETQQYKMLGNGWTVEVIKHIFSFLNINEKTYNDGTVHRSDD